MNDFYQNAQYWKQICYRTSNTLSAGLYECTFYRTIKYTVCRPVWVHFLQDHQIHCLQACMSALFTGPSNILSAGLYECTFYRTIKYTVCRPVWVHFLQEILQAVGAVKGLIKLLGRWSRQSLSLPFCGSESSVLRGDAAEQRLSSFASFKGSGPIWEKGVSSLLASINSTRFPRQFQFTLAPPSPWTKAR